MYILILSESTSTSVIFELFSYSLQLNAIYTHIHVHADTNKLILTEELNASLKITEGGSLIISQIKNLDKNLQKSSEKYRLDGLR